MKKLATLILCVVYCLLAGCSSSGGSSQTQRTPRTYSSLTEMGKAVKVGMTEDEVIAQLGEPEKKEKSLFGYSLKGNPYDALVIIFKDGHVISVSGFIDQKPVKFQ